MAMTEEWLNWTRVNLKRGCSVEQLQGILFQNGFTHHEIIAAMSQSLGSEPTEAEYRALAEPPLVRNIEAFGGYRVPDDRLQLFVIPQFLNVKECKALIDEVNSCLRPSTLTMGQVTTGIRSSSTGDLDSKEKPAAARLEQKISRTLGLRSEWGEVCQGQKYLVGQEFKPHTDYFTPDTLEYTKYASQRGQRTWTFTVYLNDCPKGGATDFPEIGQRFYPRRGQATIWNNLYPDGRVNPFTRHHGMPVEEGEKIIITKWFRARGKGSPFVGVSA